MYSPYLRGKLFELILLRDNAQLIAENKMHPIIEPVKEDFKALDRTLKIIEEKNIEYTLIVNPITGENPVTMENILENFLDNCSVNFQNISLGYILRADSNLENLILLLRKNKNRNFSLVHYGFPDSMMIADKINGIDNIRRHIFIDGFAGKLYQRHLKKDGIPRILIRDGFKTQRKNSLYPESEHFSDLHITYPDEGMDGFGDYLTVGDEYYETGGPAYAVAIHLTYLNKGNDMFIYHFISDRTDSPTDPGGKFLEALGKLVVKVEAKDSPVYKSEAYYKFDDLYNKQHYPGLGYVKKLSMQHHIELVANFLNQA